jgi:hypothetical protein
MAAVDMVVVTVQWAKHLLNPVPHLHKAHQPTHKSCVLLRQQFDFPFRQLESIAGSSCSVFLQR